MRDYTSAAAQFDYLQTAAAALQGDLSALKASAELAETLRLHVRQRLAAHSYPREIEFVTDLPKTPSGKLQRFILRNQEIAKQQADATQRPAPDSRKPSCK